MFWYAEVIIETALFALLWFKDLGLRWFPLFIGIDVLTSLLQFASYRAGYRMISAWIWEVGVFAWVPLMPLAFTEAIWKCSHSGMFEVVKWRRHAMILSWWIAILFACKSAAFIRMFPMGNIVLLWADCAAFVLWMILFMRDR